jgi:hypothetical protein
MTGYRSLFFRHDCKTQGCQIETLPYWDDFIAAFPRGIRPTDIDAMVEINGHFLFIEQKGAGVSLGNGQRRALAALAAQPNTTVLVMRPVSDTGSILEILMFPNPTGYQTVPRASLINWLTAWARNAERQSNV